MHRISFAPELSATLRRVSCWITLLLRCLHDLEQAPALLFRDRARLGNADEVPHAALVLLVVNLEPRALLDRLAVQPVGLGRADLDDDRLVHLVGDHGAEPNLALATRQLRRGGWRGGFAHASFSAFARRVRLGLGVSTSATTGSASTVSGCAAGSSSTKPLSTAAA